MTLFHLFSNSTKRVRIEGTAYRHSTLDHLCASRLTKNPHYTQNPSLGGAARGTMLVIACSRQPSSMMKRSMHGTVSHSAANVILGPVSAAQHSQPTIGGALFSMAVSVAGLSYLSYRYLNRTEEEPRPRIGNIVWVSAICFVFIGLGVWELVRSFGIAQ
jgi:hypothetical protein